MRNKIIVGAVLLALIFSGSLMAQEKKLELPKRTTEQKLERNVYLTAAIFCATIAYAKSIGKTAEDYGEFMGKIFAPGWEKGISLADFMKWTYINMSGDKEFTMDILEESESAIVTRWNKPWLKYFEDGKLYGATLEEYENMMWKMMRQIADYLEIEFKQKKEGDSIIVTVAKKK
ncbi:hypothetical protein ACFLT2_03315 [Acidobacteriota bacterium]